MIFVCSGTYALRSILILIAYLSIILLNRAYMPQDLVSRYCSGYVDALPIILFNQLRIC